MTPEDAFGKVLKEIRQEHSLSQEELGFESGYHRNHGSRLGREVLENEKDLLLIGS